MRNFSLPFLLLVILTGCQTSAEFLENSFEGAAPSVLAVQADCYIPTFYFDEPSRSGRSDGVNVQFNYDLCEALAAEFKLLAPTLLPQARLVQESLVSVGGQLGGRYGVKTVSGWQEINPSEERLLVPNSSGSYIKPSELPLSSHMSEAKRLADSRRYRGERTEVMYDGGPLRDRSDYYQALNAMSFPSDATSSEVESRLLMVVSGQHLGGEYASSKAYEVTSEQMTSNVIGGILAAAAGVSSTYEYTSTSSRLYMTFLFINSEGSVEYANVAGAPLCSDPTRSAQLLLGSAFVFGSEALTENRFC